jgi:membrane protease YdiL (CAAX protease family)
MEPAPSESPSAPAPPPRLVLTLFVGLALAFPLVGGAVQALNAPLGLLWTEAFLFLGPAILVAALYNGKPLAWLGLRSGEGGPIGWGLCLGLANYPLAGALEALVRGAVPTWLSKAFDLGATLQGPHGWQRVVLVAAVGLAAPLGEETLFRGLIQKSLLAASSPRRAIAVTALLFAAIHYEPIGLLARVELGALFGFLAYRTGSLWAAIAAHAASNLFALTLYFMSRNPTEGPPQTGQLLLLAGVGLGITAPMLAAMHRSLPPVVRVEGEWVRPAPLRRLAMGYGAAAVLSAVAIAAVALAIKPLR